MVGVWRAVATGVAATLGSAALIAAALTAPTPATAFPLPLPVQLGSSATVSAGNQAYPASMALLPNGSIAWADPQWRQVGVLDPQTLVSSTLSLDGVQPMDIAADPSGGAWVIGNNGELVQVALSGSVPIAATTVYRTPGFESGMQPSVTVAANGLVFWSDPGNNQVLSYRPGSSASPQSYPVNLENYPGPLVATPANTVMTPSEANSSGASAWTVIDAGTGQVSPGLWAIANPTAAVVGADGRVWGSGRDARGTYMTWFDPDTWESGLVRVDYATVPTSLAVDTSGRIWWMAATTSTPAAQAFDAVAGTVSTYPLAPLFATDAWHGLVATADGLVWSAGGQSGRFTVVAAPTTIPTVPCTASGTVPVGMPIDCTEAFGSTPATIAGTWYLDGEVIAVAPGETPTPTLADDGAVLTASVTVTYATSPLPVQLTIAPTKVAATKVTGFTPTSGPADGGTEVTFTGTGFYTGQQMLLDGVLAPVVGQVTDTAMTVTVPARPRPLPGSTTPARGEFTLVYPDREQAAVPGRFSYQAGTAPVLDAVSPSSAEEGVATGFTLTGVDLVPGTVVTFTVAGRSAPATGIEVTDETSLTGLTPTSLPVGSADITVRTPSGDTATLTGAFTVVGAPTPTGVSPASGPTAGGQTVTITGSGFLDGAAVMFGSGVGRTPVTVSENEIVVETPPMLAGPVEVLVINPGGDSAPLPIAYTYVDAPTVASVSPSLGPTTGGTRIVISGTGFTADATVSLSAGTDSAPATDVDVVGLDEIHATVPEFAPGPADITVTTAQGVGTLANAFTFDPSPAPVDPPSISAVSPNVGAPTGGTAIAITGSGFVSGLCTVTVGSSTAPSVQVVASTRITAVTPSGAPGAADVSVTCANTGTGTLANGFTYAGSPVVSGVTPWSGDAAGGTTISVTGSGFASNATVLVGGAEATDVTVEDAGAITAVTPPGAPGFVDVQVVNPGYPAATLPNGFAYLTAPSPSPTPTPSPTVSPSPSPSPTVSPTPSPSPTVSPSPTISPTPSPTPSPTDSPTPTPTPAPGPGPAPGPAPSPPPVSTPALWSVSPNEGPVSGGSTVTVTGRDLRPGVTVLVGGRPAATVSWVASTTVSAVVPAGAPGAADVVVVNPDGGSALLDNGFTYESMPQIATITPGSLPVVGDTVVTITGSGFAADATVTFGGVEAYDVTVVDGSTITVVSPVGRPGPAAVTVTNPNVGQATVAAGVEYTLLRQSLATALPRVASLPAGRWTTLAGSLRTDAGQEVRATARCEPRSACRVRVTQAGLQVRPEGTRPSVDIRLRLEADARVPFGYAPYQAVLRLTPRVLGGTR